MFTSLGLTVDVLWRKSQSEKGLTATALRQMMGRDQPWEHLVPPAVARLIKDLGLLGRLRLQED
jgi:hypothetical protein